MLPDKLSLQILEEAKSDFIEEDIQEKERNIISYMEDLPYYSLTQMIDMGTYNSSRYFNTQPDNYLLTSETAMKRWFEEYTLLSLGIVTERYNELNKLRIQKLHELYRDFNSIKKSGDIDLINSRKQSILNLGWNPEINFENIKTRLDVSKFRRIELEEQLMNYELIDLSNDDIEIDSINESKLSDLFEPLYVLLTYTNTTFGKVISKVTNCQYSHSGLSFSSKLDKIYTFNAKTNGISFESLKGYLEQTKEGIMCLYTVLIPKNIMIKVKETVDNFILEKDKNKYSFLIGIGAVMDKPVHLNNAMICSQFVDTILKTANEDILKKDSYSVLPSDFYKTNNKKLIKLYEGPMIKYNESTIKKKIEKAKKKLVKEYTSINEVKEFPIGFDNDGNLLIKNMKRLNFDLEYSKSHKLLKTYESTNNFNGMVYELCKLWFMNSVLEEKIYNKKINEENKKQLLTIRSKILNDFNKYIKLACKDNREFNFTEYYNNTPFSDATYKINYSTLKYGFKLIKDVITSF